MVLMSQAKHWGGYIVDALGFFIKFPAIMLRFKRLSKVLK
jgi:hypothetical protein